MPSRQNPYDALGPPERIDIMILPLRHNTVNKITVLFFKHQVHSFANLMKGGWAVLKYPCPLCNKRACDSYKTLKLAKLSKSNEYKADIIIKCHNCKNPLAVKVVKDTFVIEQVIPHREVIS